MKKLKQYITTGFLLSLGLAVLVSVAGAILPQKAEALQGSQFNPGRIIDDGTFFNPNAMSAQEIQAFLNSKVPVCDTWGTQASGRGMSRAAWGQQNGNPAPYTCLKDFRQDIPGYGPDAYCDNGFNGGNYSAAEIIRIASYACGVSPKVILTTLQKEQSLITDDWPWPIQYRSAMGYGCPDTAACDSTYYGFFNQVFMAARQFKRYARQSNYFNYRGGATSYVQYNPNAGCGGTNVYMETQATAGLYNYTPYQPNAAALNNLYGTGDGCSAYGNRNFWRMFNDWFGSTASSPYAWSLQSANTFTDHTKTTSLSSSPTVLPGQRIYAQIKALNTGTATWTNSGANPMHMGTSAPQNRDSAFCTNEWLNCARPANMIEGSVGPGQVGTFEYYMVVPDSAPGSYREYFNILSEWNAWAHDIGFYFQINIAPKVYSWNLYSSKVFSDQTKTTEIGAAPTLQSGQEAYVQIKALNTGNQTWTNSGANPVRMGTSQSRDRTSAFCGSGWPSCNRPATMIESSVAPGQVGTFEYTVKAPATPGVYKEYFSPVAEWKAWMNDLGLHYQFTVPAPAYTWSLTGSQIYTDQNKTTALGAAPTLNPGQKAYVSITARNTGNRTWTNTGANPLRMGTANPRDRNSAVCDEATWILCRRPAVMQQSSVAPGQDATFEFWIKAPTTPGVYKEYFSPVAEMLTWLNDPGLYYQITVPGS